MADVLTKNLRMAVSAAEEPSLNTRAAGNFHRFVTTSRTLYIPSAEKFDDRGKVGLGTDLPNVRTAGYLNPATVEITSSMDNFLHPILMKRALGMPAGAAPFVAANTVAPAPDAGAYTHTLKLAKTVTRLGSSSMVWGVAGADYMWLGMTLDTFRVEQNRVDIPTFTATLVGTGRRGVIGTAGFEAPTTAFNAYETPVEMNGAETQISYTTPAGALKYLAYRGSDAAGTGSIQRAISWDLGLANANRTDDRRPGDPRIDFANPFKGHYLNRMTTGDREVTCGFTIALDDATAEQVEVVHSMNNEILTNFTFSVNSTKLIVPGTGTLYYGMDFVLPKVYMDITEGVDDAGLAVMRGTLFPVLDDSAGIETALRVTVRNNKASIV